MDGFIANDLNDTIDRHGAERLCFAIVRLTSYTTMRSKGKM